MSKKPDFRKVNVLIADADAYLARAAIHNLRAMGFEYVHHVRSCEDAIQAIRAQAISFIITEWDLKGGSGLDLVRNLRSNTDSPSRALPVIMLTGRGELSDVQTARDVGITEFVVKPFSAQTLFKRIEQVVDQPRKFVIAKAYTGPERRRRGAPPVGVMDRRIRMPVSANFSREALKQEPTDSPLLLMPDTSLRSTLALGNQPLAAFITADVLREAQNAIDALADEALQWVREDLSQMQASLQSLKSEFSVIAIESLKEAALSIKARAGTFGYRMASDVARLLYLFLSIDLIPTNQRHLVVVEKHIQVLMVIFAQGIKEREGLGAELYIELEHLISVNR